MEARQLSEEARGLLRRIVEGHAYRRLMLANIRGHALKYVYDLEEKIALASALQQGLEELRPARALYREIRTGSVVSAIRTKMDTVPYPGSQVELACCLRLCELVTDIVDACYESSVCDELAVIARARRGRAERVPPIEQDPFVAYCQDPDARPSAQEHWQRWLGVTLRAIGRPGTRGDRRAVELGLRDRGAAEIATSYLERLEPFRQRCGLPAADAAALGVELPPTPSSS